MFKNKSIIFRILLIIALPLALLLTNIEIATFNLEFFRDKYREYDIMEETGISEENLIMITDNLLNYLKDDREDLIIHSEVHGKNEQIFEDREIMHMEDVKVLFKRGYTIRNFSFFIVLISLGYIVLFDRKKLGKTLVITSLAPLGIMGILGTLITIDYNKYFTYFHEIFFSNDLWLLNPKTDILIQMLPLGFFSSITFRILTYFVIQLSVLLIVGLIGPRVKLLRRFFV